MEAGLMRAASLMAATACCCSDSFVCTFEWAICQICIPGIYIQELPWGRLLIYACTKKQGT